MNEYKRKIDREWDDRVAEIAVEVAQEQAAARAEANQQLAERGRIFEQGFRANTKR